MCLNILLIFGEGNTCEECAAPNSNGNEVSDMAKKPILSIEILHKLLVCDAEACRLWWRERPLWMFTNARYWKQWNDEYAGVEAFQYTEHAGYKRSKIFNKDYSAHRVIWAMVHGEWPKGQIDHKNHARTDNRISNLRVVTNKGNGQNRTLQKNNTSGHTGVQLIKSSGKWNARIVVDGKQKSLGCFDTAKEAAEVRQAANKKHGYHANHGKQLC